MTGQKDGVVVKSQRMDVKGVDFMCFSVAVLFVYIGIHTH